MGDPSFAVLQGGKSGKRGPMGLPMMMTDTVAAMEAGGGQPPSARQEMAQAFGPVARCWAGPSARPN
jgi:hypothetical protein